MTKINRLILSVGILMAGAIGAWADENPPFSQKDPAAAESDRSSSLILYRHIHDGADSAFLRDILPETDSAWNIGASGREWLNGYFDNMSVGSVISTTLTATTGTITNIVSSSIGTNQIAYNNGTKLVGSSSATFNGSTVAFTVPLDMNSKKIVSLANGSASSDAAAFGQIPTAATQSDQETATSVTTFVSPGRQQYHPGAAKFWVSFNSAGTVLASYNVASVTDNGTGDWTINIATDFSSSSWAGVCFAGHIGGVVSLVPFSSAQAAGTFRVHLHRRDTGAAADPTTPDAVWCVGYGDQ